MPTSWGREVSLAATGYLNRVLGPEAEVLSCGDKKVPKETLPDDWVPAGLPSPVKSLSRHKNNNRLVPPSPPPGTALKPTKAPLHSVTFLSPLDAAQYWEI